MSSAERTEKATPKRREEARKEGRIARRPDLAASFALLSAIVAMRAAGPSLTEHGAQVMRDTLARAADAQPLTESVAHGMLVSAAGTLGLLAIPVVLVALVAGVGGNLAQGGVSFTPMAFKPRGERFNPGSNLKRVFGKQAPVELIKAVLRLFAVSVVCYGPIADAVADAPALIGMPASAALGAVGSLAMGLGLRAAVVLVLFAGLDYGYGWYLHEKSLKMTKQEVKQEYKEMEGDPLVKSQRRRAARALVRQRISIEVPRADVVVTNPTHFAVALRYDRESDAAPVLVAKGADEMAARIRKIARASGVPIVENPPLARALFRAVEPGRAIAPEFFRAVAELLAFVYRERDRSPGTR